MAISAVRKLSRSVRWRTGADSGKRKPSLAGIGWAESWHEGPVQRNCPSESLPNEQKIANVGFAPVRLLVELARMHQERTSAEQAVRVRGRPPVVVRRPSTGRTRTASHPAERMSRDAS